MTGSIEDYDQIFIPGSPVKEMRYLIGRAQEIKDLENVLKRPGQHAIVIGDRGVGKTSLVQQVLNSTKNIKAIWRTCDTASSFNVVFKDLLCDCGIDFRKFEETIETAREGGFKGAVLGVGAKGNLSKKLSKKLTTSPPVPLTPWGIYKALESLQSKVILVLDEYDAVHRMKNEAPFNENTAYTMKHLSDQNTKCPSRIIVIGVSANSEELLGKHESIQRSVREIYLHHLRREDMMDFLNTAEDDLGITFDLRIKNYIAGEAYGYPYFVHLVGLECIEAMLGRDKKATQVTWNDLVVGMHKAVDHVFRAELSKYKNVYDTLGSVEKAVVDTLTNITQLHIQRKVLRLHVHKDYDITDADFDVALTKLTQEKKFLFVLRGADEVRFADPLMKPFLRQKLKPLQYER